jgi:hypothetical protein
MKMLHIVCGKKFEEEIVAMFKDLGLHGYTMISGVGGSGVTGTVPASNSLINHGTNTLLWSRSDMRQRSCHGLLQR